MSTKNPPTVDAPNRPKNAGLTCPAELPVRTMGIPSDPDLAHGDQWLPSQTSTAFLNPHVTMQQGQCNILTEEDTAHINNDVFSSISDQNLPKEFAEREQCKMNTSTPSGLWTYPASTTVSQAVLHDSGFNELTWSTTFAKTCSISGMVDSHSASFESPSTFQDDNPLPARPLPTLLKFADCDVITVESRHVDISQDAESGFGDCSSSTSHQLHSECESDFSGQCSMERAVRSPCFGNLPVAELPTPSIVYPQPYSSTVITPATSKRIYSSTPFSKGATNSVSTVFEKMLEAFSPPVPSRLIGRRMGLDTIDIVQELSLLDLTGPLSIIINNLDDNDVCRMCCVSSQWKSICDKNHVAIRKLQTLTERTQELERKHQKENMHSKGTRKKMAGGREVPLAAIQDIVEEEKSPNLPLQTNYRQFVQEAQRLKVDESLRKCPLCGKPARVHAIQERAQCTSRSCGLDFCVKCNNSFHGSRECSSMSKKFRMDTAVGTKKSKKNLRRL